MRTRRKGSFSERKIKPVPKLKKIIKGLQKQGKKIVFTNGCFDILHYGHVRYLEETRKKGDILVVAVNSDSSIKRIKGKARPVVPEKERLRVIAGLESVDYVVPFKEDTPERLIRELKPDVLVKGADWKRESIAGGQFVLSYGAKVATVKLVKGLSTTNIIRNIAKKLCLHR